MSTTVIAIRVEDDVIAKLDAEVERLREASDLPLQISRGDVVRALIEQRFAGKAKPARVKRAPRLDVRARLPKRLTIDATQKKPSTYCKVDGCGKARRKRGYCGPHAAEFAAATCG